MAKGDQRRYASSFGTAAATYAEHRPDYARAAELTATLVGAGVETTAVEPDSAMLTELRRTLPGPEIARVLADRDGCRASSPDGRDRLIRFGGAG